MRAIAIGTILMLGILPAAAQTATCKSQATEKKLAGAARNSFTKKCVNDAVGT